MASNQALTRDTASKTKMKSTTKMKVENDEIKETEISAQISIPKEGGWGWVVVAASFCSIFILDGIAITFGALLKDISKDLNISDSLTALVNSIAIALYLIASPLVSALINRFGFRACIMCGSVICSLSLFIAHFATNFIILLIFYGMTCGVGFSLINLSSSLVVGYYFEKLRAIAMSIAMCGSSLGVSAMSLLNIQLVNLAGWRSTTLLHSGMFGIIYFLGMVYRPLVSVTVTTTVKEHILKSQTGLHNASPATDSQVKLEAGTSKEHPLMAKSKHRLTVSSDVQTEQNKNVQDAQDNHNINHDIKHSQSKLQIKSDEPTEPAPSRMERLFKVLSNSKFPTGASIVTQEIVVEHEKKCLSCRETVEKPTITVTTQGELTKKEFELVQSIVAKSIAKKRDSVEMTVEVTAPKKRSFFQKLLHWDEHITHMRPMYRDDAFYDGKVGNLPTYKKAMSDNQENSGIEYQLAVSRAVETEDFKDRKKVFSMAVRRVLATMLDPSLLKRWSFLLLCACGFFNNLGILVPYVYLKDRNKTNGIEDKYCDFFVTAIGLSNTVGRLALGALALKVAPIKLFMASCFLTGLSTMLSDLSYIVYFQYGYCMVFGFFAAGVISLRSMAIVSLYGLDKLTNGTGMLLMISGIGSLFGTPLASAIKDSLGYGIAFKVSGFFIFIGSFFLYFVNLLAIKESQSEN